MNCRNVVLLSLAIILGPSATHAAEADANELALKAREVLKANCYRCHHGPGSDGGEFDVLLVPTLKNTPVDKAQKPYVTAGQPDRSWIVERMSLGEMPPKEINLRPTPADIEIIRQWIQAGAPVFPSATNRTFVPIESVLTAVRDDLRRADAEDQPYLRYFTLVSLYNNAQVPDRDLRIARAALSKAVNSLSWKPRIVVPRAVDPSETVFAVDVRQLDWDRNNLWKKLIAAYPYGVKYRDDPRLDPIETEIARLSRSVLPIVRGDWFVSVATRPPLYHILLQLPQTAGELEQTLKVDIPANFRRDQLARAGFFPSGVSGQNRLLERHEALYGAYWKSYDFKKENNQYDLKRFPLGPKFQGNEFTDQAFSHDGGEIIFHLPNGLQGYLLIDGNDNRIDAGPIEVVSDALKTSGTNTIVTGLSCMSCHKNGMIPFTDQIRDGAALFGEAQRKVKRLYPESAKMRQMVADDQQKFMSALEKTVGSLLQVGEDKEKPLTEMPEPIGEVARFYTLTALDLAIVASELGVEKPEALLQKVGENRLRELGLSVLFQGGRLQRHEWETGRGMSLMQRVSRELGATAIDVGL